MAALNAESLPAFSTWLQAKRPLGAAVSEWQFAIADANGTNWAASLSEQPTMRRALVALGDSDRKVWAAKSASAAITLHRKTGEPLARLAWLHDTATAYRVTHPGESHWLAPKFGTTYPDQPRGAARTAVATARIMTDLAETFAPETRRAVLVACEQEQLWRPAQARGWKLDVALLRSQLAEMEGGRAQWGRELGIDLLNTDTDVGADAAHAWLREVGISIVDGEGNPSLSRDDFGRAEVPDTPEAADRWVAFRAVRTLASHLAKLHELSRAASGGRVFSTVVPYAQRSGRMSITRPALQNITGGSRPLLAADPGRALVSLDYAQVEPRVAAALSGDTHLAADLEAGDVYQALALRAGARPEDRPRYKTAFLATLYGQGFTSLGKNLGIEKDAASALIDSIWTAYPDLAAYKEVLKSRERAGTQELLASGRIQAEARGPYAALNARIQATAADVFYAGCARVAEVLGAEALWLGIHDELVIQVPESQTERASAVLEREMATEQNGIPIDGTAQVLGGHWRK